MSDSEGTSVVYMCYVLVATHHEHIKLGAYLALAGVIALLLSLVLLSVISTCLLHRKPEKNRGGRVTCELLDDPAHPYQYACLHGLSADKQPTLRQSEYNDHYAKPFEPGAGISLSNHCLPSEEPHIEIHRGKHQYLPHTSVEQSVSHQNPGEIISGYKFEHTHVVMQPRGDNSDDDDYEPIGFHEIYETGRDKHGDQTDGEYVSVKNDE